MENLERLATVSDAVGERVKELRKKRNLTAAQLAERCAAAGAPELTAGALFHLENGRRDADGRRRRNVTVDELLALAYALDVAPVHLIVSPDRDDELCAMTPTRSISAHGARRWIRGQDPLPGQDARLYWSEVPMGEFAGPQVLFRKVDSTGKVVEQVVVPEGYLDTIRMDTSPDWQRVPRDRWNMGADGPVVVGEEDF